MNDQIFISYRRDGGDVTAKLICEALKNRGYTVFFDYDSLKGGVFDNRIFDAIDQCNDVILVLPPQALARCKNENDWVRQEIRHALQMRKNIIPVMMDKFEFPKKLPSDIQDVARYNGVRFHMDFFETVIDKIVEKLSTELKPTMIENTSSDHPPLSVIRHSDSADKHINTSFEVYQLGETSNFNNQNTQNILSNRSEKHAVLSLVLGIISLLTGFGMFILAPTGVIFGCKGLRSAKRKCALIGLFLNSIVIIFAFVAIILGIVATAT